MNRQLTMDYKKRKRKNTVRLAKQNDSHVLIVRQFDPETGDELAAEQLPVGIADLKAQRAALQEQISALNELIEDLEATTVTLGELLSGAAKG